jgi:glycosyltransferase involved in cell wall biosynthesis
MRKNNIPLISVIMPVYNAGDYLVEAIESIRKQTYTNWELICVNDGSTDNSWKILKQYRKKDSRIRIYRFPKNKGLAYALNTAIKKVKGDYVARMDADDISLANRLKKQVDYLEKHKDIIAIGTQIKLIDAHGRFIGYKTFPQDSKKLYELMMTMMAIQHPTLLTYTKVLKKCRYENHTTAEDVSMFFKLLQYGKFSNTKEVLFKYRIRKNSNSFKNPKKTFNLTLRSRVKAIIEWNYHPTIKGIIINIFQWIAISLLPNYIIINIYEWLRFKQKPLKVFSKNLPRFTLAPLRNRRALLVK